MIRVFIADDHAVVRRGLAQIMADQDDLKVAGEADNGEDTLKAIRSDGVDVLVLDIAMPGLSGLDVLNQLQELRPGLPVLILSIYPEKQYAIRAFKAGAAGYLTKESAPDELVSAVRAVATGKRYVSQSLAELIADELMGEKEPQSHQALSDREFQVLRLIASGRSTGQIADQLNLSAKTISTYRARVLDKLNLDTTADIIRYALEHDLVD